MSSTKKPSKGKTRTYTKDQLAAAVLSSLGDNSTSQREAQRLDGTLSRLPRSAFMSMPSTDSPQSSAQPRWLASSCISARPSRIDRRASQQISKPHLQIACWSSPSGVTL
eukprot:m.179548 g.179548  ORF g.179548 m.179548 type:complete len:110 (+) comp9983_c0_seq2:256-585(+)